MLAKYKKREFKRQHNDSIQFQVGYIFNGVDQFKKLLKEYIIQGNFQLISVASDRKRVTLKCASPKHKLG